MRAVAPQQLSLSWPPLCACCGSACEAGSYLEIADRAPATGGIGHRTATVYWKIPYCSACLRHVHGDSHSRLLAAVTALLGLVGELVLARMPVRDLRWLLVPPAISLPLAAAARRISGLVLVRPRMKRTCVSAEASVACGEWQGDAHVFYLKSRSFAEAVARANRSSAVERVDRAPGREPAP